MSVSNISVTTITEVTKRNKSEVSRFYLNNITPWNQYIRRTNTVFILLVCLTITKLLWTIIQLPFNDLTVFCFWILLNNFIFITVKTYIFMNFKCIFCYRVEGDWKYWNVLRINNGSLSLRVLKTLNVLPLTWTCMACVDAAEATSELMEKAFFSLGRFASALPRRHRHRENTISYDMAENHVKYSLIIVIIKEAPSVYE